MTADPHLVERIARQLTAALELRDARRADRRIDRIMLRTVESTEYREASFAAVQMLRDLDVVSGDEAAYLFDYIIQLDEWYTERDPAGQDELVDRLLPEHEELFMAAISHQSDLENEKFYRDRGEYELADLVRRRDDYQSKVIDGQDSIFGDKEDPNLQVQDTERSTDSRLVVERVLALSANESMKEWMKEWHALMESLDEVTPETAVLAIQEARAIGAIGFEEHLRLVDMAIESLVWEECAADRQYSRLQQRSDALEKSLRIEYGQPESERPFEYRMVEAQRQRRYDGLTAVVLRRLGEHRLANLLITDPGEYRRIRGNE